MRESPCCIGRKPVGGNLPVRCRFPIFEVLRDKDQGKSPTIADDKADEELKAVLGRP
jgi:hypothetical protein